MVVSVCSCNQLIQIAETKKTQDAPAEDTTMNQNSLKIPNSQVKHKVQKMEVECFEQGLISKICLPSTFKQRFSGKLRC